MIVSLTGFMGCGKSSVGEALSKSLGWDFIDLDSYIEYKIGLSIPQIFEEGEKAFRAIEAEALRDITAMHEVAGGNLVLALGGGTVTTPDCLRIVKENTRCFWLNPGIETILKRLSGKEGRPLLDGLDENGIKRLYESREILYRQAGEEISTFGNDAVKTAGTIYEKIS